MENLRLRVVLAFHKLYMPKPPRLRRRNAPALAVATALPFASTWATVPSSTATIRVLADGRFMGLDWGSGFR